MDISQVKDGILKQKKQKYMKNLSLKEINSPLDRNIRVKRSNSIRREGQDLPITENQIVRISKNVRYSGEKGFFRLNRSQAIIQDLPNFDPEPVQSLKNIQNIKKLSKFSNTKNLETVRPPQVKGPSKATLNLKKLSKLSKFQNMPKISFGHKPAKSCREPSEQEVANMSRDDFLDWVKEIVEN